MTYTQVCAFMCGHIGGRADPNAQSALSELYIVVVSIFSFRNLRLSFNYCITVYLYAEVTGEDRDRGLLSERTSGGQ